MMAAVRGMTMPMRVTVPGETLELLVLAADERGCAGVDTASGALVRATYPEPAAFTLDPFDVASAPIAATDEAPDPTMPEAVELARLPRRDARLSPRRAERWLRPLLHPRDEPLLGFMGPAVPFWERAGDRPSLALVEPRGGVRVVRRAGERGLRCQFAWRSLPVELPLLAPPVAGARRLLVALTPPRRGNCHKVVAGLLP
jgi:hypothetical protein